MGDYKQAMNEIDVIVNKTVEEIEQKAKQRGYEAANVLTNEVKKVLSGQRSGRVYKVNKTGEKPQNSKKGRRKSKKGGVVYTASAPGEPPALRFGTLQKSFKRRTYGDKIGNNLLIHVITESDLQVNGYLLGDLLENGTERISPRPFKQKTIEVALPKVIQILQKQYRISKG